MNQSKPKPHALAATLLLLCCGLAHADLLPVASEVLPADERSPPASAIADAALQPAPAFVLPSDDQVASGEVKYMLAAPPPAAIDTGLWAFITRVRSQQQGDSFVQLENQLQLLDTAAPAQVPLPGALWLLVMGLLGLAGVRFTGVQAAPGAAHPLVTVSA